MSRKIGVTVGSCPNLPFGAGGPLEGVDPYAVTESDRESDVAEALTIGLHRRGGQWLEGFLGRLPTGLLAAIALDDGDVFVYAVHASRRMHCAYRVTITGPIGVVNDPSPFKPDEAKAILDRASEGMYWNDVVGPVMARYDRFATLRAIVTVQGRTPPHATESPGAAVNSAGEGVRTLVTTPTIPRVVVWDRNKQRQEKREPE